jgi:hypothetical protein
MYTEPWTVDVLPSRLEPQEMSDSTPFLRVWVGSTSVSEDGS